MDTGNVVLTGTSLPLTLEWSGGNSGSNAPLAPGDYGIGVTTPSSNPTTTKTNPPSIAPTTEEMIKAWDEGIQEQYKPFASDNTSTSQFHEKLNISVTKYTFSDGTTATLLFGSYELDKPVQRKEQPSLSKSLLSWEESEAIRNDRIRQEQWNAYLSNPITGQNYGSFIMVKGAFEAYSFIEGGFALKKGFKWVFGARGSFGAGQTVYHGTSKASFAESIVKEGIDINVLKPGNNRFGAAFYVGESAATSIAELAYHNRQTVGMVSFTVNSHKTLNLTSRFGNLLTSTPISVVVPKVAMRLNYKSITYLSRRNPGGVNLAVFKSHNSILTNPIRILP